MSCGTFSPLKSLLPHSTSPASHPFTLSSSDSTLHNLSVPLCYKVAPQNHPLTSRAFCSLGPDRLRGYSALRPLTDFPLLSPLHGKKASSCRGQCLQAPTAIGPCLLSFQSLQASCASGAHQAQQNTLASSLSTPFGLYGYSIPISPHFSNATSPSKPADNMTLSTSESLLHQTSWNSSINHCL